MTTLPPGWTLASLGELCAVNPKHSKELPDSLDVGFVPMAAVDDRNGRIDHIERRPLGEIRKGYTHFCDDDVIFAKITPCMENGNCAVAEKLPNGVACGSTEFFALRSLGAIEPRYLYRFLRQETFRQHAKSHMTGVVGQARVPRDFLELVEMPLPPLNEQRRIVTKLEAIFKRTRATRERLERLPTLLDKLRRSCVFA